MIDWPYPKIIAHRGAGLLAPENTLAAVKLGMQHGHTMFEFDVKLSADDVPLLMHDSSLERTTNGSGLVRDYTWAQLAALDAGQWHSEAFTGEPIPQLDDLLVCLCEHGMMANVEIKPSPGLELHTGRIIAMACRQRWADHQALALFSSFSELALHAAAQAAPHWPRALLMDRLFPDWLIRCRRLGCVAVDWNEKVVNPALIAQAHEAGLRVVVYTVNDPERAMQLLGWGVDAVITDAVDMLKPSDLI